MSKIERAIDCDWKAPSEELLKRANELRDVHGRQVIQYLVDEIQAAIRGGNDAMALELSELIRALEFAGR